MKFINSANPADSADAAVYASWSDTQIVCTVPPGLAQGGIYVIAVYRVTSSGSYVSSTTVTTQNTIIVPTGRYVAFGSSASNLVAGDTNGGGDVFVHDSESGQTTRVSASSFGAEGNGGSGSPSMSADGRYVAFNSNATNLVTGDTNGTSDIFVHDRQTGQTTRVSVDSSGTEGNGSSFSPFISLDGRFVVFQSLATNFTAGDTNGNWDIYMHDMQTGQTTRVSVNSAGTGGDGWSYHPSISSDNRYVAFSSDSTNLVTGDGNGVMDVFLHDMQTGQTTRVSVSSPGAEGDNASDDEPFISSDGRNVAFGSKATNPVTGDTNARYDVFVRGVQTGQTTRVSVSSSGAEGNGNSLGANL